MTKFGKGNSLRSKLTNEQVWTIRERYMAGGCTQASLSREYGVTTETIGRIVRGETRVAVPTPTPAITAETIAASVREVAARLGRKVPLIYQQPPIEPTATEKRNNRYLAELGLEFKEDSE